MTYPMPGNISGIAGIFAYDNLITNNYFGIFFIFSIAIILTILLRMRYYPLNTSLSIGFFMSFILGVLLWVIDAVSYEILAINLTIFLACFFWSLLDSE